MVIPMVTRYCLLSPYDITLWLSVIYHPMVIRLSLLSPYGYPLLSAIPMFVRYCPLSPYGYQVLFAVTRYPLLSDITLWLSVIFCYHPMVIRYCITR